MFAVTRDLPYEVIALNAYVKQTFRKGFFITEESIIKIHDIITKRLKEKNLDGKLTYKVYRKDSLVYETADHQEITKEENSVRNSITRVEINHKCEHLLFKMSFAKDEDTHIEIETTEKDFAYLLFSDIKEYLTTEVLRFREFRFQDSKFEKALLPLLSMVMLLALFWMLDKPKLSDTEFRELLNSESTDNKINYLISNSRERLNSSKFWSTTSVLVFGSILLLAVVEIADSIYPRNVFYLGKETSRYDNLCSIRSKITWGIVISFAVSTIAGLIVYYMTK